MRGGSGDSRGVYIPEPEASGSSSPIFRQQFNKDAPSSTATATEQRPWVSASFLLPTSPPGHRIYAGVLPNGDGGVAFLTSRRGFEDEDPIEKYLSPTGEKSSPTSAGPTLLPPRRRLPGLKIRWNLGAIRCAPYHRRAKRISTVRWVEADPDGRIVSRSGGHSRVRRSIILAASHGAPPGGSHVGG